LGGSTAISEWQALRKRRAPIEVVGLSFLDMICCAFGGVLVLYLLADDSQGTPDPVPAAFVTVEAVVESSKPFNIGISFEIGGKVFRCFRKDCPDQSGGNLQWMKASGSIMALLRSETEEPARVQVALVSGNNLAVEKCVLVWINAGKQAVIALKRQDGFRGEALFPMENQSCP
jgi:hypothetical protein